MFYLLPLYIMIRVPKGLPGSARQAFSHPNYMIKVLMDNSLWKFWELWGLLAVAGIGMEKAGLSHE